MYSKKIFNVEASKLNVVSNKIPKIWSRNELETYLIAVLKQTWYDNVSSQFQAESLSTTSSNFIVAYVKS